MAADVKKVKPIDYMNVQLSNSLSIKAYETKTSLQTSRAQGSSPANRHAVDLIISVLQHGTKPHEREPAFRYP